MKQDKLKPTSIIIIIFFLALTYVFCRVRDLFVREDLITYKYIYIDGIHIHHYYIGIALILMGLILLYYSGQRVNYAATPILGIGTGMVLDKVQKITNLRFERIELIFIFVLIVVTIPIRQYLFSKFKYFISISR